MLVSIEVHHALRREGGRASLMLSVCPAERHTSDIQPDNLTTASMGGHILTTRQPIQHIYLRTGVHGYHQQPLSLLERENTSIS